MLGDNSLNRITRSVLRVTLVALLLVAPLLHFSGTARAGQLRERSLYLGDNLPSATTDYTFSFTLEQTLPLGSIEFEVCSNSPLPNDACTPPVGFNANGAILTSQSGETGFSLSGISTTNRIVLSRAPSVPSQLEVNYVLSNIINPQDASSTYYVRLLTYQTNNATGASIDDGGIALSLTDTLSLSLVVPPFLVFCTGVDIPTDSCASAVGSNLDLGVLSEDSTSSATSDMLIQTNSVTGYSIILTGQTMTSGNNVIPAVTPNSFSQSGISQFGMNLRDNSFPDIGRESGGLNNGVPSAGFNLINQFSFADGATIATANDPDNTRFTASYITNVNEDQPAGTYSATLTYIATATF